MFYDYKSEENVQDVILECFCPLIEDIEEEYINLRRNENLSIYAPSRVASEIVDRIYNEIDGTHLDEESEIYLFDEDEDVVITLACDGRMYVEKARGMTGKFKSNYGDVLTYVYDGFSKKDIDDLWKNDESVLVFGFEEEEFDEIAEPNELLEICVDEDENLHGFTFSSGDENNYRSISYYSTERVNEDKFSELIGLFL